MRPFLWWSVMVTAFVIGGATLAVAVETEPASVELQPVESTLIKEVGYDEATQTLIIVFVTDDATYEYYDVPKEVYEQLMAAESKGSFFTKNIKDKYRFEKKQ